MKKFLLIQSRPEDAASDGEYQSMIETGGLPAPFIEIQTLDKPQWTMEGQEELFKKFGEDNNLTTDEVYGGYSDDETKNEKAFEISRLAWTNTQNFPETQESKDWSKAEKMLPIYREEMNEFANFLKEKFSL